MCYTRALVVQPLLNYLIRALIFEWYVVRGVSDNGYHYVVARVQKILDFVLKIW